MGKVIAAILVIIGGAVSGVGVGMDSTQASIASPVLVYVIGLAIVGAFSTLIGNWMGRAMLEKDLQRQRELHDLELRHHREKLKELEYNFRELKKDL